MTLFRSRHPDRRERQQHHVAGGILPWRTHPGHLGTGVNVGSTLRGATRPYQEMAHPLLTVFPAAVSATPAGTQGPLTITPAGASPGAYRPRACWAAAATCPTEGQAPLTTIWSAGSWVPAHPLVAAN